MQMRLSSCLHESQQQRRKLDIWSILIHAASCTGQPDLQILLEDVVEALLANSDDAVSAQAPKQARLIIAATCRNECGAMSAWQYRSLHPQDGHYAKS